MLPPFPDPHLDKPWTDRGGTRREAIFANTVAEAITQHYGQLPLSVRYGAADAAIAILRADVVANPDWWGTRAQMTEWEWDEFFAAIRSCRGEVQDESTFRQLRTGDWTPDEPPPTPGDADVA
jgi:hypothetical protein